MSGNTCVEKRKILYLKILVYYEVISLKPLYCSLILNLNNYVKYYENSISLSNLG